MVSKGKTFIFLLTIVYAALDMAPGQKPDFPTPPKGFKNMARKLMKQCLKMGHRVPQIMLPENPGNRDKSGGDKNAPESGTLRSTFVSLLSSLSPATNSEAPASRVHFPESDNMDLTNKMWNCTGLQSMIKLMRNSSNPSACYMRAFVAPFSWKILTTMDGNKMERDDYDDMVWAAKPFLQNIPDAKMNLPLMKDSHMATMMKMLREVFFSLSEPQRVYVRDWVKEQVFQNYFNCTRKASSKSGSEASQKPSESGPTSQKPSQSRPTTQKPSRPSGERPAGDRKPSRPSGERPAGDLKPSKPSGERPAGDLKPSRPPGERATRPEKPGQSQGMPPLQRPNEMVTKRCPPKLKWLKKEVLKMMGPYLSLLQLDDVNSCPKDEMCEFFKSSRFNSCFSGEARMKPLLGKKFLQAVQACPNYSTYVDRLGMLACYYQDPPAMNATLTKHLLSQLGDCNQYRIKTLKRRLVKTLMSSSTASPELLQDLDTGATVLPPETLAKFPVAALKRALTRRPNCKWSPAQAWQLAKKILGRNKTVSIYELMPMRSAVRGVSISLLKMINLQKGEDLDEEGLKSITKHMKRAQRKALLLSEKVDLVLCQQTPCWLHKNGNLSRVSTFKKLLREGNASSLVHKVPDHLLSSMSVDALAKANFTSLDQIEGIEWNQAQSALLVKIFEKMLNESNNIRKLGEAVQGITCKMIDGYADKEKVLAIAQASRRLPKPQAVCAARKLFIILEKERPDYFQAITKEELNDIPWEMLIHLPPEKVKVLPDSVCPEFLDKMKEANWSSLPPRASSRPALIQKALQCLTNRTVSSNLSSEEVLSLGPLVCELPPSELRRMAPEALNTSLQAMVSCRYIPPHHRAEIIQLFNKTYGNPCDWSAETVESVGPLILWDNATISALCCKPGLKEVLYYLRDSPFQPPASSLLALRKKLFLCITSSGVRRKRDADSAKKDLVPTVELTEILSEANVYWSPAQLDNMTTETFTTTVETLGAISDYSSEHLAVLQKKAAQAWGPVSRMNESLIIQLGCLSQGFSTTDLETLPFTLDTLEEIAHCGWTEPQIQAVWRGFAKRYMPAEDLGAVEMIAMSRFFCGLSSREIRQVNVDAFKEAVGSMGDVQCSLSVTEQLKGLSVSAFGKPSTWTGAEVSTLGNIMAGLDAAELGSLDPSVLSYLSQSCIPLIPADRFAVLSVSQLEALGPDNAAMVTDAQKAKLGDAQLAALDRAQGGSQRATGSEEDPGSRAPSLNTEGTAAFLKPFLFLFLGFLLL